MFGKRKKASALSFDRAAKAPVIRASICTGEKVAGFRDKTTGKFTDVMLIRNDADYQEFLRLYGIDPAEVKREW